MPDSSQAPRRRWRMLLPLLFVLALAGLWSVGWFYAAGKAQTLIDAALAREATRGRDLACASKTVSGFPFRIVFDCAAPNLRIARGNVNARFEATHLKAAVQIYRPNHIIAELQGPLKVDGGGVAGEAAWQVAQASLILSLDNIEQLDVALKELHVLRAPDGAPLASAALVEAHGRKAGNTTTRDFDIALLAGAVTLADPALPPQLATIKRAELAGTVRGVPQGINEDVRESLRLWQQERGLLEVARLWLDTGDGAILASGTLKLEASGRPSGTLKAALANAQALAGNGAAGPVQLVMAAMQFLGKRVEVEGRKAVEIEIVLSDGMVKIGPATLGPLPPLY